MSARPSASTSRPIASISSSWWSVGGPTGSPPRARSRCAATCWWYRGTSRAARSTGTGPMLARYLETGGASEVGQGEASARLLKLFGPSSMVVTHGMRSGEPNGDFRAEACGYYDDRLGTAGKLANIHAVLASDMPHLRM